jgi:hypothetical protein
MIALLPRQEYRIRLTGRLVPQYRFGPRFYAFRSSLSGHKCLKQSKVPEAEACPSRARTDL